MARSIWPHLRSQLHAHVAAGGTDAAFAALHPGLTPKAVRHQRTALGLPLPRPGVSAHWTAAEQETAERMQAEGATHPQIAAVLLGRSVAGVGRQLQKLAARRRREAVAWKPVEVPVVEAVEAGSKSPAWKRPPPTADDGPETPRWAEHLPRERAPGVLSKPARRRVAPLFETVPTVVRTPSRPKLGNDSFAGSVLTGVLIHPAHRRA